MERSNNHIIHKHKLVLTTSQPGDFVQQIGRICRAQLPGALEDICDQFAPPNQIKHIERLVIDLGKIDIENLEHSFLKSFKKSFEAALKTQSPEIKRIALKETSTQNVDTTGAFIDWVRLGFSETLPLSADIDNASTFFEKLWKENTPAIEKILFNWTTNETWSKRFIYSFSDDQLAKLLERIGSKPSYLKEIERLLSSYDKAGVSTQSWAFIQSRVLIWQEFFALQPFDNISSANDLMIRRWISNVISKHREKQLELPFEVLTTINEIVNSNDLLTSKKNPEEPAQKDSSKRKKRIGPLDHYLEEDNEPEENIASSGIHPTEALDNSSSTNLNDMQLRNAGLVILAPYLPAVFERLEFLEGNQFKNEESWTKAVHLLQYAATGKADAHMEQWLILNKILCGIEISEPVPLGIELSQRELETVEDLLKSVVEHWDALGNTSIEGLQEGFIERPGILNRKDRGWQLSIERQTLDVLMDRIPWSFSVIKLPWMKSILFTEW